MVSQGSVDLLTQEYIITGEGRPRNCQGNRLIRYWKGGRLRIRLKGIILVPAHGSVEILTLELIIIGCVGGEHNASIKLCEGKLTATGIEWEGDQKNIK